MHVLERVACSVKHNQPVLLVGETGTGKTTVVQNLAMRLGQPLTVLVWDKKDDLPFLLSLLSLVLCSNSYTKIFLGAEFEPAK